MLGNKNARVVNRSTRSLTWKAGVLLIAFVGFASAQGLTPEPADVVFTEEAAELQGIQIGSVRYTPPTDMDLMLSCAGGGGSYGYLDTDFDDSADTLRVIGAAMVNRVQYEEAGMMVLGPLRNRATLQAQAAGASATVVHVEVTNGDRQDFVTDLNSIDINASTSSSTRATASAFLRGATVTGTRVISMPDEQGICVVVRYDVPISGNDLQSGDTVPGAPGSSNNTEENPVNRLPAPGQSSDF